jgi:hypothetical protein
MFGVSVDSDCVLLGCRAGGRPGLPGLTLRTRPPEEIAQALPGGGRPLTWRVAGREPDLRHDPEAGYALEAAELASFHISPRGVRVSYAAAPGPAWRWQRHLIGRVLPLAVTLLGREPLHAAAVACGKSAVLLAGESGTGKSTLASRLMLAGCGFLADDVTALSLQNGRLLAHPGPGVMSLRSPSGFGELVGADSCGLWMAVEREPDPLAVGALYLLEPAREGITPVPDPEPSALLAASFNLAVRDGARLARQLDVCAALARVRVARVGVPEEADFAALAGTILADLYRCEVAA